MDEQAHIPVLMDEVMRFLSPQPGEVAVDCTTGLGGHSTALAKAVGQDGTVVGFDLDAGNLASAAPRTASRGAAGAGARFIPIHGSFVEASHQLNRLGLRADMVLADLGFSSNQMDDPKRGFSFGEDGPLDMRLDRSGGVTAADLVNESSEVELAEMIFRLGEDPYSRKIARKLVQSRLNQPIRTTAELARLVTEAYGPRAHSSRMHPATRTFMALRIAVNDELGALRGLLEQVSRGAEQAGLGGWLNAGARVAIISFHSLEDRLVKQVFADLASRGLATVLTRKPVGPSELEVRNNPRSRSAKLRVARIGVAQKTSFD
jgi:16S rRNA (cytosine1402-N4)-methyltransferase